MNEENMNEEMSLETFQGTTIWFKHSYGFISWSKNGVPQKDLFAHFSDITGQDGNYRTLRKGDKVSFQLGTNHNGVDKAVNIKVDTAGLAVPESAVPAHK